MVVKLLDDLTADGESQIIHGRGGIAYFFANADTWGGGTIKLLSSPDPTDSDAWFEHADLTFTAKGYVAVQMRDGIVYKATLTGATSPAAARAWLAYESEKKLSR